MFISDIGLKFSFFVASLSGQGQRLRVPGGDDTGTAKRSHPMTKARSGIREEQPCA